MSGIQPVAVYAMKVPPGDIMVPAVPEFAAMFRLTMAAIDPSAPAEQEDMENKPARATLKLVRVPDSMFDEDSEDDDDYDFEGDEESSDEDEANGGPSDPKKAKKPNGQALIEAMLAATEADEDEDMEDEDDDDDDEEDDLKAMLQLQKLMKASKGKGKAVGGMEDSEDDEDDEDDEAVEMDEVVLCTLDVEKNYQQPLDFVVGEGERVFFKVSGTHTVHLTGNYVIPQDDGQASLYDEDEEDEEEDDYDLSPDEDELEDADEIDELEALENGDDESDDLDDLADPRITELASEDEAAPKLVKEKAKGKNKRLAEDTDEDESNLDDIMAKVMKKETATDATANGEEKKLSKAEKKKQKKQKKNDGEAGPAPVAVDTPESKKDAQTNGASSEKKVQFAKNLEQGPTPSATPPTSKSDKPVEKPKATSVGIKTVDGIIIDDRKAGSGPAAKKGSRLEMRYIGKLESGKVFDSNKSGKPFSFKLGAGEVIKGWDTGLLGIQVGGERRLTIPASHAYGKKGSPPVIPPNSKLIFDIKCLTVK